MEIVKATYVRNVLDEQERLSEQKMLEGQEQAAERMQKEQAEADQHEKVVREKYAQLLQAHTEAMENTASSRDAEELKRWNAREEEFQARLNDKDLATLERLSAQRADMDRMVATVSNAFHFFGGIQPLVVWL